jgi:hypothetical protein
MPAGSSSTRAPALTLDHSHISLLSHSGIGVVLPSD